jgi:hypothetical protein
VKDRDFFLGATIDHIPDVFAANAHDRDRLLERLTDDPARPRLAQYHRYDHAQPVLRRWVWQVPNLTTDEVLAEGRAPTQRVAIWAKHRAYRRVLAAVSAKRDQEATS